MKQETALWKQEKLETLKPMVKQMMRPERYEHTLGVMYTSAALAMRYEIDILDAQLAGLLHDCAKAVPFQERLELCKRYQIPVTSYEGKNLSLLHGKLGAAFAREKFDIQEDQILSAIQYHTTGKPNMTVLEKIIFTADYIEPLRNKAPNLARIRKLSFTDLDESIAQILQDTILFLEEKKALIDPIIYQTRDFYTKK